MLLGGARRRAMYSKYHVRHAWVAVATIISYGTDTIYCSTVLGIIWYVRYIPSYEDLPLIRHLACRTGPDRTGPHTNRIPVFVLCAHAKPKTLISYWSISMDIVKIVK